MGCCSGAANAGVVGNLVDRLFRSPAVLRGHVVDFLQLPYFAIFNVADMCITTSAVLIIYLSVIKGSGSTVNVLLIRLPDSGRGVVDPE